MSLVISLQSEILKTKRSAALYFTVFASAVIPFIFLLDVATDGISPENQKNSFNAIFREGFGMAYIAIMPLFVIVVCTLLPQVEYKNNTWKQVYASPQRMGNLYIAKLLHSQGFILLFLVGLNTFLFIVAVATHFIVPSLHLLNQPLNVALVLAYNVNAYIAVLAIHALQFWLGLRFKNFIVPMAIGLAMWIVGNIMLLEYHSPMAQYFPYAYPAYSFFGKYKSQLGNIQLAGTAYAVLFLVLGFIDFKRRKARG